MDNKALKKFEKGKAIAYVLAVAGVIVALVFGFVFLLGSMAFDFGSVFFIAAAVLQLVSFKKYAKKIKASELSAEEANELYRSAVRENEFTFGVFIALFAVILPLADARWFDTDILLEWIITAKYYVIASVLLYLGFIALKYHIRKEKENVLYTGNDKRIYYNVIVLFLCASVFALTIFATYMLQAFVIREDIFQPGIMFYDYDSFVEFMETPDPDYEDYLNPDNEERIVLKDSDGNVLVDCAERNPYVAWIEYGDWTNGYLPIKVVTDEDKSRSFSIFSVVGYAWLAIYAAEIGVTIFVYIKLRKGREEIPTETENSGETAETIEKPME